MNETEINLTDMKTTVAITDLETDKRIARQKGTMSLCVHFVEHEIDADLPDFTELLTIFRKAQKHARSIVFEIGKYRVVFYDEDAPLNSSAPVDGNFVFNIYE